MISKQIPAVKNVRPRVEQHLRIKNLPPLAVFCAEGEICSAGVVSIRGEILHDRKHLLMKGA
jgi:hypothetical protein